MDDLVRFIGTKYEKENSIIVVITINVVCYRRKILFFSFPRGHTPRPTRHYHFIRGCAFLCVHFGHEIHSALIGQLQASHLVHPCGRTGRTDRNLSASSPGSRLSNSVTPERYGVLAVVAIMLLAFPPCPFLAQSPCPTSVFPRTPNCLSIVVKSCKICSAAVS